nr:MAG TPA: hypothetical protein [Caudoviricetes sp.]DAM37080.1 MAG TPA: hypothetical protein [Inoviridae sp.]
MLKTRPSENQIFRRPIVNNFPLYSQNKTLPKF